MKLDWNRLPPQLRTTEAKRIAATSSIGVVVALVYALFAPNWYRSTLTVVPATPSKGSGLGAQLAGALGADLPIDLGNNADVERIAAVFESTSVTDAVISKFDLSERYDEKYIEHTRRELWTHCSTRIDRKAKLVALSCEDKDPKFVKEMLGYFGDYGNEVFRRVSALREFEEKYKVIDLESQSKAVVSAMASLRSQEISKELQLSYLNSFSSRDESTALQLRQQLAVMSAKFRKLEEPPAVEDPPGDPVGAPEVKRPAPGAADIFPAALSVPRLRFELEQLYRDRKIREADLLLLMQRLEMAKVNEARDTSAFQILDPPPLPTYKSRPRRAVALATGLIIGLLCGFAWTLGPSYLRGLSEPGGTENRS